MKRRFRDEDVNNVKLSRDHSLRVDTAAIRARFKKVQFGALLRMDL